MNDEGLMLKDIIRVSRHYQRSIRVDADLGRHDALTGFICHSTAASVCMDNGIPIVVLNLMRSGNVKRVVLGEDIGTEIRGE